MMKARGMAVRQPCVCVCVCVHVRVRELLLGNPNSKDLYLITQV